MRVLLMEDEARMAQALSELMRQEGYEVDAFGDGESALEAALSNPYDIMVLDVMVPKKNGFEVARAVRDADISTPILMLTAKSDVDDKVTGLDSGADDYLTKPFMTRELLARLRALGRRSPHAEKLAENPNSSLSFGDIELDPRTMTLTCTTTGESTRLSDREFRILEYLVANQGLILTREQLYTKIWGLDNDSEYNNIEVYMSFVRKKLAFVGAKTQIKAIRGVGYELRYES